MRNIRMRANDRKTNLRHIRLLKHNYVKAVNIIYTEQNKVWSMVLKQCKLFTVFAK